jgi:hypothetical protein
LINQKQQISTINQSVLEQFQKVVTTLETFTEEDVYDVLSEMNIENRNRMGLFLDVNKSVLTTTSKLRDTFILFYFPVGDETKESLNSLSELFLKNIQNIKEMMKEILISSEVENFSFTTEFIKRSKKNGNIHQLHTDYINELYLLGLIPIEFFSKTELVKLFRTILNSDNKDIELVINSNGQLVNEINFYQKIFEEEVLQNEVEEIAETLLTDGIQYINSFKLIKNYFDDSFKLEILEKILSKMIELLVNKKVTIRLDCFYKNIKSLKDWNLNSNCNKLLQELLGLILEDDTIPILVAIESDLPVIVKVLNLIKEFNFDLSDVTSSNIELDFDYDDVNEFLYPIPSQEELYGSETFEVLNTGTINFIINFTGENSPSILSTTEKVLDFGVKFYNQKFGKKIKFKFGETKVLSLLKLLEQDNNILSTETVSEEEIGQIINFILNQTIGD